jgi:hypothetical protein
MTTNRLREMGGGLPGREGWMDGFSGMPSGDSHRSCRGRRLRADRYGVLTAMVELYGVRLEASRGYWRPVDAFKMVIAIVVVERVIAAQVDKLLGRWITIPRSWVLQCSQQDPATRNQPCVCSPMAICPCMQRTEPSPSPAAPGFSPLSGHLFLRLPTHHCSSRADFAQAHAQVRESF